MIVTDNFHIMKSYVFDKVEKILKGSLDLIPSPSPCENSNYGREKLLEVYCWAKTKVKVMGLNPGYLLKSLLL